MSKKLSKKQVEGRLRQEWNSILEENRIVLDRDAVKKLMRKKAQPEFLVALGFTGTIGMMLQDFGKTLASSGEIKDEQQLSRVIETMREAGEKLPTVMRKAMKEVASVLPRRGGPGRQPKLNAAEAKKMVDQVLLFIGQGKHVKQALQRASELAPQLLGKKVGARTLQKAWDKRGAS